MARQEMVNRVFTVEVLTNKHTGLMMAISDDLEGLYVHGRSYEELNQRIPEAIKALIEETGIGVSSIQPIDDLELPGTSFERNTRRFEAALAG